MQIRFENLATFRKWLGLTQANFGWKVQLSSHYALVERGASPISKTLRQSFASAFPGWELFPDGTINFVEKPNAISR